MLLRTIRNGSVFKRCYSSKNYEVFDRSIKKIQRDRISNTDEALKVEYLRNEVARRTIERLTFIKRDFPKVLDLGCHSGNFEKALMEDDEDTRLVRNKFKDILMIDSSEGMLNRFNDKEVEELNIRKLVCDEEELNHNDLGNEFDAIISNLSIHWINDLPSTLTKINKLLRSDGLFLASMICEDSIFELRTSLQLAELERKGGISMGRISPMIKVDDMTNLLKQANFNMVTIDVEEIVVQYPNIFTIMQDLQLMGENNSNKLPMDVLNKDVLISSQVIYEKLHGENGVLPLTFRIMFIVGWKGGNQPKVLERGSGDIDLKKVL